MRSSGWIVLAILLAGCAAKPSVPTRTTPTSSLVLTDATGDAAPSYDIVAGDLFELNGSLALRVQVVNFAEALPLIDARISTTGGDDRFARLVVDPAKPTQPKVRAEDGRWSGAERKDMATGCWFPSFPTNPSSTEPWWIVLEFPHNRTGLAKGGTVAALTIEAVDPQGKVQDTATSSPAFPVRGGPNPYGSCPLNQERGRVT